MQHRRRQDGRAYVNEKHFEGIRQVADRVIEELPNRNGIWAPPSEPLRWVVHGGPEASKTHVAKDVIKDELFSQILQWQQGHDCHSFPSRARSI